MPRAAIQSHARIALRIRPADKAKLMRAVALQGTDMTEFVLRHALRAADAEIEKSDKIKLGPRDAKMLLDLLENPPAPNARMLAAARAFRDRR
jgi:uncharacterized protein (DUF1778 family)